ARADHPGCSWNGCLLLRVPTHGRHPVRKRSRAKHRHRAFCPVNSGASIANSKWTEGWILLDYLVPSARIRGPRELFTSTDATKDRQKRHGPTHIPISIGSDLEWSHVTRKAVLRSRSLDHPGHGVR